jgi:glycosyltransferase involved in cell wall biosynthesis
LRAGETNPRSKRVALVYSHPSTFVLRDLEILRRHFSVEPVHWTGKRSIPRLLRAVARADSVLSWFALDHAFVAAEASTILRKSHFVILGGVDCARIEDLEYGIFLDPLKKHFATGAVRRSVLALPVQSHLVEDFLRNSGLSSIRFRVIPTGFDSESFVPRGPKENMALTVGGLADRRTALRKGLDVFARAAAVLPHYRFVAAGAYDAHVRAWIADLAGGRVEFPGRLSDAALLALYQNAKVYCQFSRYEGLPNALCEAMLCEDVPCGTMQPGVAEAIGETGFYCANGDQTGAIEAIERAMGATGAAARNRIASLFPVARRERALVEVLSA